MDALKCPRCQSFLVDAEFDSYPTQRCKPCKGFWLKSSAYKDVRERGQRQIYSFEKRYFKELLENAVHHRAPIDCPECLGEMDEVEFKNPDFHIDVCASDGAWFDEGEIYTFLSCHPKPGEEQRDQLTLLPGSPVGRPSFRKNPLTGFLEAVYDDDNEIV